MILQFYICAEFLFNHFFNSPRNHSIHEEKITNLKMQCYYKYYTLLKFYLKIINVESKILIHR